MGVLYYVLCLIKSVTNGDACNRNPAGTKGIGYMCPAEEFTSWPAYLSTTAPGDTVKLTGNFALVSTTGIGYFRTFPILQDTGRYKIKGVGAIGSKSFEETFEFTVNGLDAEQLEWCRNLLNIPGVFLCADKKGVIHVLGSKDDPAYLQEVDGDTGATATDQRAIKYIIRATTASPAIYTGTINTTPNA